MKINSRSVRYGAVLLAITGIISQVIMFFYRIMLSRLIGPEGMGLFQLIFPYYSLLLSLSVTGLCVAVSRAAAEYKALDRPDASRRLVRTALCIFLVVFVILAVVTLMFATPIAKHFVRDERVSLALLALLPCLFFTGIENVHKHYFYGQNMVNLPAASEVIEQVTRTAAVLLLLRLMLPQADTVMLLIIVTGMVIAEVASSTFLRMMYRRHDKTRPKPKKAERRLPYREMARVILRTSIPISLSALLGNLLSSINIILIPQRLLVSGLSYQEALAQFGILSGMALPMLMLPGTLINGLSIVIVPRMSETIALGDRADMRSKIDTAIYATTSITMPALAMFIPLGGALGELLYGTPGMDVYMAPLAAAVMLGNIQGMTGSLLSGCGHAKTTSIIGIIATVMQLGCTFFLASQPGIGIMGVVAGIVAGSVVGCMLNIITLSRRTRTGISWWRWFIEPGVCSLLAGMMAHFMYLPLQRMGFAALPALLVSAVCGLLIYFAGTAVCGRAKDGEYA